MFMPAEYAWAEPVVIAAAVVFAISWIGKSIIFGNKFFNALMTAIVFALIFGALAYFRIATLSISFPGSGAASAAATSPQPSGLPANPVTTAPPGNPVATVPNQ